MANLAQLTDTYQQEPDVINNLPVEQPDIVIGGNGVPTRITVRPEGVSNRVDKILNSLFRDDDKRYQLWPEKVIRGGLTAAGDALAGNVPQWAVDKDTGEVHTSPQMIEKAQEISALAGTGGLAGGTEGAAFNATPSLRPALKYKDKIYKGKEGQQHQDVIPKELYPEFEQMAMNGEDLTHYNFGFMNHKGQFLDREKALTYAIDEGLLSHHDANYGALTSTMKINKPSQTDLDKAALLLTPYQMQAYKDIAAGKDGLTTQFLADSSKPGTAIEAMGKTKLRNDYLYHGTTSNSAKNIDKEGLMPQRGSFINKMYGDDAIDDIVSMADKSNIKNVKTAIINQVAEKLNKSRLDVTPQDIEKHGVMYGVKKSDDHYAYHESGISKNFEGHDIEDVPIGVEKGDWYSRATVKPNEKITGKSLSDILFGEK